MTAAELRQELGKVNFVSFTIDAWTEKSRDAGEWGYCPVLSQGGNGGGSAFS